MIKASITKNGSISLAALGNDVDKVKNLPKLLKVNVVGQSLNFKTGRKHFVVNLEEVEVEDNSEELKELESVKKQLAASKKEVTKLKKEVANLENQVKLEDVNDTNG